MFGSTHRCTVSPARRLIWPIIKVRVVPSPSKCVLEVDWSEVREEPEMAYRQYGSCVISGCESPVMYLKSMVEGSYRKFPPKCALSCKTWLLRYCGGIWCLLAARAISLSCHA